ncbi:MAG: hypothetical protein CVT62_10590 [Actinobacteria bacterium HGW-Actinobacteria-2]|nr:MAG: hypothetical protein CVT62_10590 [Actinobacteria bacterium HGW-Actinobacteria-2]
MSLFSRRSLPPELAELVGKARVLARSASAGRPVLGLTDRLIYPTDGGWSEIAWHEIERGGWDNATRQLNWSTVDGTWVAVELDDPGRIPQLFQERVNATVAYSRHLEFDGHHSVVISARRSLVDVAAPLIWHLTPGKRTTAEQAAASTEVELELRRLRRDFDLG